MTNSKLITAFATYLLMLISFPFLVGCSENSPVDQVENPISPPTTTAQASRAIALATKSAEQVKATYSTYYADAIATEEALKNYYDDRKNWPLILHDTFDNNQNEWPIEEDDGDLASVFWEIENGKYKWNALAKEGFIYWTYPSVDPVTDFFLSVDAQQLEGPKNGQYGLVFRLLDQNNYYLFMIDLDENYSFELYDEGEWFTISYGNISSSVLQNAENRITIIGEGSNYRFYINDKFISEETDLTLPSGRSGIAIGLTYPQDQAKFEFDNFELRSPREPGESE